jgi:hypothetical protein
MEFVKQSMQSKGQALMIFQGALQKPALGIQTREKPRAAWIRVPCGGRFMLFSTDRYPAHGLTEFGRPPL